MSTPNDTLAINIGSKNRGGILFAKIHIEDNDTYTMMCSVRMQGSVGNICIPDIMMVFQNR